MAFHGAHHLSVNGGNFIDYTNATINYTTTIYNFHCHRCDSTLPAVRDSPSVPFPPPQHHRSFTLHQQQETNPFAILHSALAAIQCLLKGLPEEIHKQLYDDLADFEEILEEARRIFVGNGVTMDRKGLFELGAQLSRSADALLHILRSVAQSGNSSTNNPGEAYDIAAIRQLISAEREAISECLCHLNLSGSEETPPSSEAHANTATSPTFVSPPTNIENITAVKAARTTNMVDAASSSAEMPPSPRGEQRWGSLHDIAPPGGFLLEVPPCQPTKRRLEIQAGDEDPEELGRTIRRRLCSRTVRGQGWVPSARFNLDFHHTRKAWAHGAWRPG
ncbi:hypothetical protein CC1G_10702 [Coprinopsis cinerea okayama7|uniref:Uncharacterized protein n=1 Tax=Coprinopsis cinerea (strain Okayama-7 / 130 / ATCC MYA-4618 / FGSC 9003) TaxID=240176 RepID=A8NBC1_COPC7|nr:hypothetical protein CC1G_10702 [Coprinopsis cinerea okayama7\|eukprot:XP_001832120.2 hypothetical protein CC1G_10702 [Coprinopsis cinerea okayama7\